MTVDKRVMSYLGDAVCATRDLYYALDRLYDYLDSKDEKKDGYSRQKRIARQIKEGEF